MSSSRSNVTGRSSSHARPIRGAPQPMDGHAYTLEEINSLTAEQACWVEANPNFNDMVVPHDDEADMVDSNETVRGGDSNGGYHYATSEGNPVDHTGGKDCFGSSRHPIDLLQGPRRDPSDILLLTSLGPHRTSCLPINLALLNKQFPLLLLHLFLLMLVLPALTFWIMDPFRLRNGIGRLYQILAGLTFDLRRNGCVNYQLNFVFALCTLGFGLRLAFVALDFDGSVCTEADPCTWDTFANWLMKHNPDTSNTEVVANTCRHLRQMPNERAVNFYNGFREWQLDAETYGYSHHEITGFVERLDGCVVHL
ncbi:hypothetical protein MJO29_016146 [Puccinia striiformis f. sp. tritici]|nr:hypothetical protein MJO29_016146 [Puccinia striiformis f. sp. tritici]